MEFIEGKWYKNPGDFPEANKTYGRFLKWENCCWHFTEYINNGVLEVPLKSTWWAYEDGGPVYPPLTDLSEIQPYLPEGHPDKQFVLSENWYVLVTEKNWKECFNWRFSNREFKQYKNWLKPNEHLVGITKSSNGNLEKGHDKITEIKGGNYDFGQEITYDQFKKYVLKQQEEDYSYLIKLFKELNIN